MYLQLENLCLNETVLPQLPLVSIWFKSLVGSPLHVMQCQLSPHHTRSEKTLKSHVGSSWLISLVATLLPIPLGSSTLTRASQRRNPLSIAVVKQKLSVNLIVVWETGFLGPCMVSEWVLRRHHDRPFWGSFSISKANNSEIQVK